MSISFDCKRRRDRRTWIKIRHIVPFACRCTDTLPLKEISLSSLFHESFRFFPPSLLQSQHFFLNLNFFVAQLGRFSCFPPPHCFSTPFLSHQRKPFEKPRLVEAVEKNSAKVDLNWPLHPDNAIPLVSVYESRQSGCDPDFPAKFELDRGLIVPRETV